MRYFDYQSVAREAKIPEQKLRKLVDLIGKEFPNDPMMAELHAKDFSEVVKFSRATNSNFGSKLRKFKPRDALAQGGCCVWSFSWFRHEIRAAVIATHFDVSRISETWKFPSES